MVRFCFIELLLLLFFFQAEAKDYELKFEGNESHINPRFQKMQNNQISIIQSYLPYNPVIVESGGCTGTSTIKYAKKYPFVRIIAFEPNPRSFEQLKTNIKDFDNITPIKLAINTYNGTAKLYLCHGASVPTRLVLRFGSSTPHLLHLVSSNRFNKTISISINCD